jgi:hypothetical protein
MRTFIGYDDREHDAAVVARFTLREISQTQVNPEFLDSEKLAAHGLLNRLSDHRGGQDYDLVSNASKSTRFAVSRFLVPLLCQNGWALFTDCDVLFLQDPRDMLHSIDPSKAVYVVKHQHTVGPRTQWKMVNQRQDNYRRKNWSSVMLFNCDHPSNRRLSLRDINERPGRDLHAFYWLDDREIGDLRPSWNWLVGVQPKPPSIGIAHFTLGGPWINGWQEAEHDSLWLLANQRSAGVSKY